MVDQQQFTVDDIDRLVNQSRAQQVPPTQRSGGVMPPSGAMTVDDISKMAQPAASPTVGFAEDFARASGAGLGRGSLGFVGLPGDIETLGRAGLRYAGKDVSPETVFPTSQDVIGKAQTAFPALKEHLEYHPQYDVNRYVKAGTEMLPGALIGPGGLGVKAAGSFGAGIASEGVGDLLKGSKFEGTPTETALKVAATIPAFGAGSKIAGMASVPVERGVTALPMVGGKMAEKLAMERASGALATDVARGTTSLEDIRKANLPAAAAGTQTKNLMQSAAGSAPDEAVSAFRARTGTAAQDASSNVQQHINDVFGQGTKVDPFDLQTLINQNARTINGPNYRAAFSDPIAQNIKDPNLDAVVRSLPKNTVNDVADMIRMDGNNPAALGLVKTNSGWQVNPDGMPLQFWDYVKRDLDTRMGKLKEPVTGKITDPQLNRVLNNQNQTLKSTLDRVTTDPATGISKYADARGAAAELSGHENAIDLGMGFLSVPATPVNQARLDAMYKSFEALNPEQQQNAAYGLAGAYSRMLESNPTAAFKLFTGPTGGEMQNRFRAVMGPDADSLIGKTIQEGMNRNIQALKEKQGLTPSGLLTSAIPIASGATGYALSLGENLLQSGLWAGDMSAVLAAAGFAGVGKLYTMSEAKIAGKVLQLMSDPTKAEQLAKMVASDPNARSFAQKTMSALGTGAARVSGVESGRGQNEPKQSTGGRIGRASGGSVLSANKADQLIKAAESAKKAINSRTEVLLDQPDEKIAGALAIAKRHI